MTTNKREKLAALILRAAELEIIKKAVFSKPQDSSVKKSVLTLKSISGRNVLQLEVFTSDNKAKHQWTPIGLVIDQQNISREPDRESITSHVSVFLPNLPPREKS